MYNDRRIIEGKWEPVEKVDFAKRIPEEWAKIYGIKLLSTFNSQYWSEYEWAYNFPNLNYYPASQDFDKISEMEMRAYELRRDLFLGADVGEREVLDTQYIETQWVIGKMRMF